VPGTIENMQVMARGERPQAQMSAGALAAWLPDIFYIFFLPILILLKPPSQPP
jgi:hypothetical protein